MPVNPIRTEMPIEETGQFRSNPGGSMNTICDGCYGYLVLRGVRPNRLPHSSGYPAMQFADAVSTSRQVEGEDRHIESILILAQRQELLFGNAKIVPITGKMFFHH